MLLPVFLCQVTLVGVNITAYPKGIAGSVDIRAADVVLEVGVLGAQQLALFFHCGRELFRLYVT